MPSNIGLFVLVINTGEHYKHWGLLINDINNPQAGENLFQVKGAPGDQQYVAERVQLSTIPHLSNYASIGEVSVDDVDMVRHIAREKVPICNDDPNWNSQNYVMSLLGHLEARDCLIDKGESYMRQKRVVQGMKELEDSKFW